MGDTEPNHHDNLASRWAERAIKTKTATRIPTQTDTQVSASASSGSFKSMFF